MLAAERSGARVTVGADIIAAVALRRQFDIPGDIDAVASQLVGLHASRLSGPYAATLCRAVRAPGGAVHPLVLPAPHNLLTVPCMRGTLHSLSLADVAALGAAFRDQRSAAAAAMLRRAGVAVPHAPLLREAREILGSLGPTDRDAWVQALQRCGRGVRLLTEYQLRRLIQASWHVGGAVAVDKAHAASGVRRQFMAANEILGAGTPASTAQQSVARRYLRTYGPATLRDLSWWTGWGVSRTESVLAVLGAELCAVHARGRSGALFLHEDDLDALRRSVGPAPTDVQLLSYEDPSVKAYFESRWRYLGDVPARSLFWYAGEALASAWLQGRLAATWRWDRPTGSIRWVPVRRLTRPQSALLRERFADLGELLRLHPLWRARAGAT